MGFTPLPGLMMSTRAGDLDPLLPLYLQRTSGLSGAEVETILNTRSGLLGVSGLSSDLRDVQAAAVPGSQAELAAALYAYRVARQIGSYIALLGGIDLLVFTDDLGIHNAPLRAAVCANLGWAGVQLDLERSAAAQGDTINIVSVPAAPVTILALPTDEEGVIARAGFQLFGQMPSAPTREEA
jgi:acetate kinase